MTIAALAGSTTAPRNKALNAIITNVNAGGTVPHLPYAGSRLSRATVDSLNVLIDKVNAGGTLVHHVYDRRIGRKFTDAINRLIDRINLGV